MTEEPRVIDGADRRKQRFQEMLAFIHNNGGATTGEIKSFMVMRFGLKHKTTAEYIQEAHLAKLITLEATKWFTTANYKKLAKYLYA